MCIRDSYQPDPAYIPDTSFAYIGSDANAIMGYRRVGSMQAIICLLYTSRCV